MMPASKYFVATDALGFVISNKSREHSVEEDK
jgi:hypothetical protein